MPTIKDIPKVDRPREKLLDKGVNALSKSDLLAILLGSGIKGTNVRELANTIIKKFNTNFLELSIKDLTSIKGIGSVKAVQIIASINLVKRFYEENSSDLIINNYQIVLTITHNLIAKKKEYLVCLYLDSRNKLIKKETLSIGILDKSLIHPREVFTEALRYQASNIILVHNHPSGNPAPSQQDKKVVKNIAEAGNIMGVPLLDFIIVAKNGSYSFFEQLQNFDSVDYVADYQLDIFNSLQDKDNKYKKNKKIKEFEFIDLFAGIGGFHLAASDLGGECVFASEIDAQARKTYEANFLQHNQDLFHSNNFAGDITKVDEKSIPDFDFLFAGFPCQPFSSAGNKKGFKETRGTLFFDIERILSHHKPKYIMLENVKHLIKHDNGNTWNTIKESLQNLGYIMPNQPIILSPHHIGIPQNRERVFLLGIHKTFTKLEHLIINLPSKKEYPETNIFDIIDYDNNDKDLKISKYEQKALNAWNEFKLNIDDKLSGFAVWIDEFNKNYDYSEYPKWRQDYIIKNRKLYFNNKKFIDSWLKKYDMHSFNVRERRFEWQAGDNYPSVNDVIVQFRQSGIRCKRPNFFPALVAMVQIPVIPSLSRKLSIKEVARLQSFADFKEGSSNTQHSYKQFGNSVNVDVIKYLIKELLQNG
jgi:DNA (cytosine-5)-methyltransferase 1